ncbi:MAG: type III-B CRISPR-associated protein Cas10/Cmr2 [Candidatus Poribacteria bacterium]|nr:type III-B CRISPR-associated protein Cas10/Cmr2 [Candidatus Poribacteria bacterium]
MSENQSKRHMLMFTIGPVQSFIEAARKTEDLWMGSYILSYLVATAMEQVQAEGIEIIYPAVGTESPFEFWRKNFATPSFPNLFLAIGNRVTQDELVTRAKKAENSVKSEFEIMAKRVLDKAFNDKWRTTYVEELCKRQIPDFFDIYWVITEKSGRKYGDWYDYTASSLAAIKNCRVFKQTNELGRKCSLDGICEILHLKENEPVDQAMKWWEGFAKSTPRHCRQKEALSAVSLTKRMGMLFLTEHSRFIEEFKDNRPRFPSTSEVATANYKEQILCKPHALEIYTKLCKAVIELRQSDSDDADTKIPNVDPLPKIKCPLPNNVDGEWLYEETYNDSYLERYYNINASKENVKGQIEQCKKLRGELVQSLKGEPGKYYAAIALDGDDMGEKIWEAESREQHKYLSNKLIAYTETARQIVEEEHLGKLTYAGGDDLLALANLKDLLPMLKRLQEEFPPFTNASAGVCIAHNKMPLTDVLQHARRMEKEAKKVNGKNAFGIALFKHSGNISEMVTRWKHGELEVLNIGMKLVELLDDDEISKRFLYTFRDAFKKLIGDDGKLVKGLPPILVKEEFKRLIERAYKKAEQEFDDVHKEAISETIDLLPPRITPFSDYLSFLEIINFIARESK